MIALPFRSRRGKLIVLALGASFAALPALAVDAPPQLFDFDVITPTIDSSTAPLVTFTAGISDAAPGVCTGVCDDFGAPSQLHFVHPATGQRHVALFSLVSGNVYAAQLDLPTTSAGGAWEVESIWLADLAGNRQRLSTADLATTGFDTSVENVSTTGDESPPTLTNVVVAPLAFDATPGATVTVTATASDADSGLCTSGCAGGPSQVRFVSTSTGQVRDALFVPVGGSVFVGSVDFPAGSAAGAWTIASLRLVDVAGNRAVFDGAALDGLGFATDLAATSTSEDVQAPRSTAASTTPSPIDTTSMGVTATYTVDAEDAETGLCLDLCDDFGTASQVLYRRSGSDHVRFGLLEQLAGDPFDGRFDALVDLPISGSVDVWRPHQLLLADRAGNRIFVPEPGGGTSAGVALLTLGGLCVRARRQVCEG